MFSGTPEINFSSNTTQRPGATGSGALCSFMRLSFLLLQAGHEVVGLDGLRGEAVVVPPAGEGGGNGLFYGMQGKNCSCMPFAQFFGAIARSRPKCFAVNLCPEKCLSYINMA
jgi:hypothetical protein